LNMGKGRKRGQLSGEGGKGAASNRKDLMEERELEKEGAGRRCRKGPSPLTAES